MECDYYLLASLFQRDMSKSGDICTLMFSSISSRILKAPIFLRAGDRVQTKNEKRAVIVPGLNGSSHLGDDSMAEGEPHAGALVRILFGEK
jgi:hypothetical protein